ncbi:MAG: hypothetical protein ACFCUI_11105 [Bernardetiaceae bacterium]
MRLFWILLFSGLLMSFAEGQKLVKRRLHPQVSLEIPADFRPMNEDEIASKYKTLQRSLGLFTDQYGIADLGITLKSGIEETPWQQGDLPLLERVYKASILESYGSVTFFEEGRRIVNGQEMIFFEFVGRMSEETTYGGGASGRYHVMQYALLNGNLVIFNFNCPARLRQKWQPLAHQVMASASVNPK